MEVSVWEKLRAAWEALNYPLVGMYDGIGFGAILGVAVIPTSYLPANTILMGDFGRFAELGVRKDVSVEVYRETKADVYQDYIVASVEAALAMWQAKAGNRSRFLKVTAANNLIT